MRKKATENRKSTSKATKPVCSKAKTEQACKDDSDAGVVAEAGRQLSERALARPKDELLIGAARVVRTVWYMLSANDDKAREAMLGVVKLCVKYTEGLSLQSKLRWTLDLEKVGDVGELRRFLEQNEWLIQQLPSRAYLDRHLNTAMLIRLADPIRDHLKELPDRQERWKAAIPPDDPIWKDVVFFMIFVRYLLPDAVNPDERDFDGCMTGIARAWVHKASEDRWDAKPLKTPSLVEAALVVLGVSRNDAHNWVLGATKKLETEETKPQEREQERDNHGRIGPGKDPPED